MSTSKTLRILLFVSGLMAVVIGGYLVTDPTAFHASNGIELGADASLLSEVRAPGGALLVLGILMGAGAFVRSMASTSAWVAVAVYLGYGLARLVGVALDGAPASGLVTATVIELVTGTAVAVALAVTLRRTAREVRDAEAA